MTDHAGIVIISDRPAFLYHLVDVAQDHVEGRQQAPFKGMTIRPLSEKPVESVYKIHDRGDIGGIGVVMFDLDHFKRINDTYGHLAGDHVLTQVAAVILQECRKSDMPIRFGGEEFLIFMPSENMAHIVKFAERIRSIVEKRDFSIAGRPLKVTLTGGIATHQRGETLAQLLDRADQRLYQAKQNGRNQIATET